jgi:hypothetical protein
LIEIFITNGCFICAGFFAINTKTRLRVTGFYAIAKALIIAIAIVGTFGGKATTGGFITAIGARHDGTFIQATAIDTAARILVDEGIVFINAGVFGRYVTRTAEGSLISIASKNHYGVFFIIGIAENMELRFHHPRHERDELDGERKLTCGDDGLFFGERDEGGVHGF